MPHSSVIRVFIMFDLVERSRGTAIGSDRHRLWANELVYALATTLSAITAEAVATERQTRLQRTAAIDHDRAAAQFARQTMHTPYVLGLNIGCQPIVDVVGDFDGLVFRGESNDRKYRTEYFALRQIAVGIDVGKNRRLDIEAACQFSPHALSACDEFAHPLVFSALDHS
jgi:hypothetical protein